MPRAVSSQVDLDVAENGYMTPREDFFTRRTQSPNNRVKGHSQDHEENPSNPFQDASVTRPNQPNAESLARMISNARKEKRGSKIGLRDRICCFQWTWFTMTMATGGIANVLYTISNVYKAEWLWYIGLVFFILNLVLFVMSCILIAMRFAMVPGSFMHSFLDQMESLFIPAVVVSVATIMINICEYGIPYTGPWLQHVMEWLFWVYVIVSVSASAGMYLILWSTQVFPIHTMTPVWVFPAYPLLLTAPFATNLIAADRVGSGDPEINRLAIAVCAVTVQGTGFLISFMICAAFIYRLMTQKLPRDMQRPGVFISIGPPAFTVAGFVALGQQADIILPANLQGEPHFIFILQVLSILIGLWLWGLSIWFFLVSVGSLWKYVRPCGVKHKMPFQMTWWSFVFPNTALITATEALAQALNSDGLKIFGCVMAAALIIVWTLVFITMVKCLWKRQLLWPKELESE
ncbi:Uu.00g075900.m01.CDS01 [Anthostomella pinea]|uniref:Uu.00g075900.m01.CDS01 n=1 Tax=Anthostomella pinea TaxID=933095 RepID=A0AAI8VWC2_9PEZI|nr:Uu.00g075900.m01.CDS01 [Anthostomella pinea]